MGDNITSKSQITLVPHFKIRVTLAILAIASALLPIASVNTFGASAGFSLADLAGGIAFLIPLAFIGTLIAAYHPPLRDHSALADKVSFGVLVFFLVWGLWKTVQLISQAMELNSQMRGLAGQSFPFGSLLDFVSPSIGIIAIVATYVLAAILFLKTRKKTAKNVPSSV